MTNYSNMPAACADEPEPQNAAPLLDIDRAMASMGGEAVYLRILDKFSATRGDAVSHLRDALNLGDQKRALHLVHTLKGVAATIGASYLAESARQLEIFIEARAVSESHLISTEMAMRQTLLHINAFVSARKIAPERQIESVGLDRLILQLNLQLDNFDAGASDTLLSIGRENFMHRYDFKRLIDYVEAYDYENARLESRRLTGR
jgi:HPt (histidine-containing phosphotransfer) domain-containing protein